MSRVTANATAIYVVKRNFLPEASRFAQLDDLKWAFGTMGTQDMFAIRIRQQ